MVAGLCSCAIRRCCACAPVGLLSLLVACGAGGQRAAHSPNVTTGQTQIPHPHSTVPREIVENCLAGLRHTGMAKSIGLTSLLDRPDIVADVVLSVKSLIPVRPDYYLVRFRKGSHPFALATVSIQGALQAATRIDNMQVANLDADGVAARVRELCGRTVTGVRYEFAWASWPGGADHLFPYAVITTQEGDLLMNREGELFLDDPKGKAFLDLPGGLRRLRQVLR